MTTSHPRLSAAGWPSRVIYAGTYSKPFATGIRVGFGLLPEPLLTAVRRIKGNHDFGTGNFMQFVVKAALESGVYASHITKLRRRYAKKAGVMAQALREHFPASVQWDAPCGGLYVWASLPRSMNCGPGSKFFRSCLDENVLYVPGEFCYVDDPRRRKPGNQMRLSFGGATLSEIETGIARLGKVLRSFLK